MYNKSFRAGLAELRKGWTAAAAALAIAATVATGAVWAPAARAGDFDSDQGDLAGARFVRIGLNKSIVIKLPAEARDVLVGNPEIVDAVVRTKNTAYLFARAVGQTNIFFFDGAGQQILALDLEVAQDMAALQKLIQRTIPGTRITVDTINDNVVLGGTALTPGEAKMAMDLALKFVGGDDKKVMSTINVTGKEQVLLRVRVTEIQRDVLKQFGINTQAMFSIGNFAANLVSINPFSANPTGLISPGAGHAMTYNDGSTDIDGVIRAMEQDGILRTLAEPTLTAISGESAKFLAGGQFPVPASGTDSVEDGIVTRAVGVEFKDFGVGLGFTPVVMSEGRISLKINTEVSELTTENALQLGTTSNPILIPALKVRRAETTVELPSGGSMVLAGLIKDTTKQNIDGIPGLKNLPILGTLFRSRDFLSNQTELAIIVTPFIVDAVNERQLASPLDGFTNASDKQTLLFGRLNRLYGANGEKPKGVYHGNVGFIVE